jgi:hypothetical protein
MRTRSEDFLLNAENCAELAEEATSTPAKARYRRMEAAWRALAQEQQWLDGDIALHDFIAATRPGATMGVAGRPR